MNTIWRQCGGLGAVYKCHHDLPVLAVLFLELLGWNSTSMLLHLLSLKYLNILCGI